MNMTYMWDDGTYLYHHGILGMHWGIRNGPPYPLSEGDHSVSERKAGWKKSLNKASYVQKRNADIRAVTKQYKKNNPYMSKKDAENYAKTIINVSDVGRALLVGGILAGGAIAVYTTLHKDPYSTDFIIPKNAEIFRVQPKQYDTLPNNFFYATPDAQDFKIYKGAWGEQQMLGFGTGEYKKALTIGVNNDVKIAGMDAAREAFERIKNSKEFAEAAGGGNFAIGDNYIKFSKSYSDVETFLKEAPLDKANPQPFIVFQNALAEKGYQGVIDYNDKFGKGFRVKAPVILFNTENTFSVKNIEQLDKKIVRKYKKDVNIHMYKILMQPKDAEGVALLASVAAPWLATYGITEAIRVDARKNNK